ncbi:MAG: TonB-dependent receptor [Paucibacter sp.]|nr:TonB-dependent receptor [Roseateles sp.]
MTEQKFARFARTALNLAVAAMAASAAHAQTIAAADGDAAQKQDAAQSQDASQNKPAQRANASSTSNTTTSGASQATIQQLEKVEVSGQSHSLGGGLMTVQIAPKAVSTITREAIEQSLPGANYAQMIGTIPGVVAITDDASGLFDSNYQIRGFTNDQIGVTVNGAPVNDSGNYRVYPTEYGDTENMNDITVLQGYPDVDQAVAGAAGGTIAWSTIDPSHTRSIDASVTGGNYGYRREFVRVQTGDTGPVRSWISYSHNSTDVWRGKGNATVNKVDGKSVWTIDDGNSISASLQYNHEIRTGGYQMLSKATAAANYYANYDTTLATPTDTYFYGDRVNPFKNYMLSLDGEFTLTDSLHLSVVPYFQYGSGGGGSGYAFTESTSAANVGQFGYINYDPAGGTLTNGKKVLAYQYAGSNTWRPGVIAKLIQDFGPTDTLTYGFWADVPRQEQFQSYSRTDSQGFPLDIWGQSNLITFTANGTPQYNYLDYTKTKLGRVFVSNDWTPDSQWTISVGGAYTYIQREGYGYQHPGATAGKPYQQQFGGYSKDDWTKFTPTAGVKFQLDSANQFYAGFGRSFRAPVNGVITQSNAVLAFYQQNPGAVGVGTNLNAAQLAQLGSGNQPETADTLDMGWRYYRGALSASVDAYASNLKNKQVSGYDADTGQTIYLTVPSLHQRGINAEASYKLNANVNVYASYAFTQSTIMQNTATFGDGTYPTAGKSFVDVPKNSVNFGTSFKNGPFWATVNANYRGAFWGDWTNTEKAGGYSTVNFSSGWNFDDVTSWLSKPQLKLNITNLFSRRALTFANATTFLATKGGALDAVTNANTLYAGGATYNLLQPRTAMLTLSASFK